MIGRYLGITALLAACACLSMRNAIGEGAELAQRASTMSYMDLSHPRVAVPVETMASDIAAAKFVRIDVGEVINPGRYGVVIAVGFQPTAGAIVDLGSFSLYPADNPGQFIVATQGKVNAPGLIVLSLVVFDHIASGAQLRVGVRKIALISGQRRDLSPSESH